MTEYLKTAAGTTQNSLAPIYVPEANLAPAAPSTVAEDEPIFYSMEDADLRTAFLKATSTADDADEFFNRFAYVYHLKAGNHSAALVQGIRLLSKCRALDASVYEKIHKGTPFYWLGMAAFLVGDFQTATFFFDAAVSQDILAGRDPATASSPAFKFTQIEGEQPAQAAKDLVLSLQKRVEVAIADYNRRPGRSRLADLTLDHVRKNFLRPAVSNDAWRSLATAFISYFLEWGHRGMLLELRPGGRGTAEPFFLHLFKGCVLFESLLKANPTHAPSAETLSLVLGELRSQLGIASNLQIGNTNFPAVVSDLSSADDQIETAVRFAGRIRNTVGHNLEWRTNLDRSQYDSLASMVASACLHAIGCLYR